MPEKSIREMGAWELFHYSLKTKVFRATIMGAVIIGFITMIAGLSMYTISLVNRYIAESYGLAQNTAVIIERWINEDEISEEVIRIYRSLSDEERQLTGTEQYRAAFAHVKETRAYKYIHAILNDSRTASDVDDLYYGFYDKDTQALVYICDPDDSAETGFQPGEWEKVGIHEIETFYSWNGEDKLYDVSNEGKFGWICTSGVPLTKADGSINGFILADVTLENVATGIKRFLLQYILVLVLTVIVVGWLMVRRMKRMLVKPINDIAEAAKDYVSDRRSGITMSDHFSRLSIHTGDELENLSLVMGEMEKDITEYEAFLTQVTAEKERIGTELDLARRIQADMVPNTFPAFPDRTEFDIYATMVPAKEVGGDFYNFFMIDHDHLALVMADVSGKGVPAALFMAISKTIIQDYSMNGLSPAQVLHSVNKQICINNKEQMFVTVWLGFLDLRNGHLVATNAGHEYPAIQTPNGEFALYKDKHGFVIGALEEMTYKDYELDLAPGTKLFVYTDGLTEATDNDKQLYGTDRMIDALNEAGSSQPKEILQHLQESVDHFVGTAPQFDDMTMLCIEYKGSQQDKDGSD